MGADVCVCVQVTESVPEAPDIVVELVRGTNIRFVNYRRRDEDIDTFRCTVKCVGWHVLASLTHMLFSLLFVPCLLQ